MRENSIVIELQHLASESNLRISDLLRKALLVTSKLKLNEFVKCIRQELNGYECDSDSIPEYRKVFAQLHGQNRVRGLIPMPVRDPKLSEIINTVILRQSAESLESLLHNQSDFIHLTIPEPLQEILSELQGGPVQFRAVHTITKDQIVAVLGSIRTTILEWSISLEEEGILGNGLTFTAEDTQKAMSNHHINIGNFQGSIGDITNSTVIQNLNQHIVPGNFDGLAKYFHTQGVDLKDIEDLKIAIECDPAPQKGGSFGSQVSAWIGKMISKAASGTWSIGVAAAGSLIGTALSQYYGLV